MDLKCPKGDFTATGETEEEVRMKMQEHAKTAHNMDEGSAKSMMDQAMSKVTGMFKK
jgi:predicted small metal-binding protein